MVQPESDSTIRSTLRRALRLRWIWLALALLVALRASLPLALEAAIPWVAERKAGASVSIDNIDLGLFSGEFVVEGLSVANPADSGDASTAVPSAEAQPGPFVPGANEPAQQGEVPAESNPALLALARLQVEIEWLALLGSHLSVPVIRLDGLALHAHQYRDGSFALPTPPQAEADEEREETTAPDPNESIRSSGSSTAVDDSASAPEVEPAAEETDGWRISIGRFELNQPDLAVYSERTGGEVVRFRLARFAIDALTSGAMGFGFGDVALDAPELFVERDWLFDPGLGGGGEAPGGASPPPSIRVARLSMNSGNFRIRSPSGPIESAIRIEIREFDTAPDHTFPIEIALELGEGSASLSGQLGISPPSFEGKLSWRDLRVPPYLLLTTPAIVPWLDSCRASGQIDLGLRSREPAQLSIRGESEFADLVFRQPETGELAFEAQRVSIAAREVIYPLDASQPRRVIVGSLEFAAPKAVFTNPPDALDELLAIFTEPALEEATEGDVPAAEVAEANQNQSESLPPDAEPTPAMVFAIEELKVADGELVFVDRSVTPRHETRIRDFRFDAAGLSVAPIGIERFEMAGLIQQKGTFQIDGKLPRGNGSIRVAVNRLDLVGYNGFAQEAGLDLRAGDASLESVIQIADGHYKTDNDLVLHGLRADATDPDAFSSVFGVSLDVALALLRGPKGNIELALPVSFDKSGAGVGMAAVVRSAFQSALTGLLTSPIKILGGLLPTGAKAESLEGIAFEPGESELGSDATKSIAALVGLLKERPALGLKLHGQTADVDEPGLAYAILRDRAVAGDGLPEIEGAGFFARRRLASALRERAEGGAGALDAADEALLSRYVAAQTVPAERYEALARARAESVRDALVAAGAPAGALAIGTAQRAEAPGVTFEFGLRARGDESSDA